MHLACEKNSIQAVRLLMMHRANLESKAFEGSTALHKCAALKHMELALFLVEYGASVNAVNQGGQSVLSVASSDMRDKLVAAATRRNPALKIDDVNIA